MPRGPMFVGLALLEWLSYPNCVPVSSQPRLLIVDDDPSMCELLHTRLLKRGYLATWQTSATKALVQLREEEFDVVITDMQMDEMDGLEFCDRIVSNRSDIHVVMMTAHGNVDAAVAALKARAHDFLVKPFHFEALIESIENACKHRRAQIALTRPSQRELPLVHEWTEVVGRSAKMDELRELVGRVANVDTSLVITGESGTGKELIARAIHRSSKRGKGPFIAINCAAVPDTLLDAELFGHAKGAFTDARSERAGLFAEAHGGVLFLDEIGELPLHLQPKLLRAIQERAVRPLGSVREVPFDARIVAATNRSLEAMVQEGTFREDLYYRLNVIQVHAPPLRERGDDVLVCAQHFVERFSKLLGRNVTSLSPQVGKRLLAHHWPGNVRELQNVMERAVVLARTEQVTVDDLPDSLRRYSSIERLSLGVPGLDPKTLASLSSLEEVERRHIFTVMKATGGNRTAAAEILGVDRRTLLRKEAQQSSGSGTVSSPSPPHSQPRDLIPKRPTDPH
jgi:DNA-binding NtrC family response regulator